MTWSDTNGRSIIYYPDENPQTVYFNKETKGDERYFVVGCFDGPNFSNFQTVGKVTCCPPKSTDVCDNQVSCPSECNAEAENQTIESDEYRGEYSDEYDGEYGEEFYEEG